MRIETLEDVGELCRAVRRKRELLQCEMAEMAGVSTSTYNRVERGENTSAETMLQIIRGCGYRLILQKTKRRRPS